VGLRSVSKLVSLILKRFNIPSPSPTGFFFEKEKDCTTLVWVFFFPIL
jgi:hypothetical protein